MKSPRRTRGRQLNQLAAAGAEPSLIADVAEKHWHSIADALSPIIGRQGVLALYSRSLHLTRMHYSWLVDGSTAVPSAQPFDDLRSALARQSTEQAIAGHRAVLQTFQDLLNSLIGSSLTDRLLRPVFDSNPGEHEAEEGNP